MKLSYTTLFGILAALPQTFGLLRVPVGPHGDLFDRLTKKDTVELDTTVQTYIIPGTDFYFGSENEKVFISFDTGSYTSYVQDSSISDNGFDGNSSTSLERSGTSYSVAYADGTSFKGEWVSDEVAFDDQYTQKANLSFGLVTEAADSSNIFGLGFYPDSPDPTFIDTLFKQEIISKRIFSVYQDEISTGEFTFGGIDTAKFSGDLTAVPVIDDQAWNVKLFEVFHGCESLTNGNTYPVLIDTGSSTGLYFPDDVFNKLINELDAKYESTQEAYIFDCAKSHSLTLDFGGIQIEIPTSSFVQEVTGTEYCAVNWRVSSEGIFQLGWTFFDNFYFVFDADSKEILIGTPNKGVTDESVVEVTDSVPSSTKAPSYSETATATTNSIEYTTASTVSLFASSVSLGSYYTGSTGYTTCSASQSSSVSSSASLSSSSISSSVASSISSSSAVLSTESSSSIASSSAAPSASSSSSSSSSSSASVESAESSSSIASSSAIPSSSSSSISVASVESSSSAPSSSASSIVASPEGPSAASDGATSALPSEAPSSQSSSFATITPSSKPSSAISSAPNSASVSSFSGYFNSSSSSVEPSSVSSSVLSSSTATPFINGSFVGGAPAWDVTIPGGLGPWSQVALTSKGSSGISFKDITFYVDGTEVAPSVFQKNGDSFQYIYSSPIEDDQVLTAHILGEPIEADSASINVEVSVTDNTGAKFVKRATETYNLESTIYASSSSADASSTASSSETATSSAASSATDSISASSATTSAADSSIASSSIASSSAAASSSVEATTSAAEGIQSTSTAIVENDKTTVATITSCSENACTEHTTTAAITTVTKTIGNIVNIYTTYCPLSDESSSAATSTTEPTPSEPAVVSPSEDVDGTSTEIVQITSTLPNGEVTTVASTSAEGTTTAASTTSPSTAGESVESTSTEVVQVTSTLPNGEVTTFQSSAASGTQGTTSLAAVSTTLIPTSTGEDSTYYVTQIVTQTSELPSSAVPNIVTQSSYNGTTNGTSGAAPSPAAVSQYEGAGNRLAVGVLGALPIVMFFF